MRGAFFGYRSYTLNEARRLKLTGMELQAEAQRPAALKEVER
jgi:hypothetical protein